MRAYVRFRLPDGSSTELGHGDLIGRLWNAALHIDDARVSEAHALVSLRGGELKLLALRGRFAVDSKPLADVVLQPGMRILLARDLALDVEDVVLPDHVLAIEGDDLPRRHLVGLCSITTEPVPRVVSRYVGEAEAWIWTNGEAWRLRTRGQPQRDLHDGDTWSLGAREFRVVAVPLSRGGADRTRALGGVQSPLKIIAYFDTVHIHREGRPPLQLRGQAARILSELVACGVPVGWEQVARQLWDDPTLPEHSLRRKWDVALARLRGKLKESGIRPDLVRADGSGLFELFRYEGDEVEDRT